jgi:uroporphyrin-III C-methyltransferase
VSEHTGRGCAATARGKVFLVGAGPGDPELLTLKAARVLAQADVVLIDDLVNPAVLDHARPEARVIAVGKRGGCKSTPQAFIERLMIHEALARRTVVRLKGGDPFLFGRGGEELAALAAAGLEVEIVNGVSAGIAAPTTLGVPLTQRDLCNGVAFVTGHTQDDRPVNWRELVAARVTLVIYMGVANIARIAAELLGAGMPASMPVAIVQDATLPTQRAAITCLRDAPVQVIAQHITSPSIIVIGEVVNAARAAASLRATLAEDGLTALS